MGSTFKLVLFSVNLKTRNFLPLYVSGRPELSAVGGSQALGQLESPEADLRPARLAVAGIGGFSEAVNSSTEHPAEYSDECTTEYPAAYIAEYTDDYIQAEYTAGYTVEYPSEYTVEYPAEYTADYTQAGC
jgi:hypothetical protein